MPKFPARRLTLAATATAAVCARAFVRHTLPSWLLSGHTDDAELIVSELVTKAVSDTGIVDPNPSYSDLYGLATIVVQLRLHGESLFIEVWDCAQESPRQRAAGDPEEETRWLIVVGGLSKTYGHYESPLTGGQVVWAEIDISTTIRKISNESSKALAKSIRSTSARQHVQANETLKRLVIKTALGNVRRRGSRR